MHSKQNIKLACFETPNNCFCTSWPSKNSKNRPKKLCELCLTLSLQGPSTGLRCLLSTCYEVLQWEQELNTGDLFFSCPSMMALPLGSESKTQSGFSVASTQLITTDDLYVFINLSWRKLWGKRFLQSPLLFEALEFTVRRAGDARLG